jgi:hypothetical protein
MNPRTAHRVATRSAQGAPHAQATHATRTGRPKPLAQLEAHRAQATHVKGEISPALESDARELEP